MNESSGSAPKPFHEGRASIASPADVSDTIFIRSGMGESPRLALATTLCFAALGAWLMLVRIRRRHGP